MKKTRLCIIIVFTFIILISFYIFLCQRNRQIYHHDKALISFIFDDGLITDKNVFNIFENNHYTCGFALITSKLDPKRIPEYLNYQNLGYEILSHSKTHPVMNETSDITVANLNQELGESKNSLQKWGFKVNGFVTPMSVLSPYYLSTVKKYYKYAFTEYYGKPKMFDSAYIGDNEDII